MGETLDAGCLDIIENGVETVSEYFLSQRRFVEVFKDDPPDPGPPGSSVRKDPHKPFEDIEVKAVDQQNTQNSRADPPGKDQDKHPVSLSGSAAHINTDNAV